MTPDERQFLIDLANAHLEDRLDPEAQSKLESILQDSQDARRLFMDMMHDHAALYWDHIGSSDATQAEDIRDIIQLTETSKKASQVYFWKAAATIALLAGLVLGWQTSRQSTGPELTFATMTDTKAAKWESGNLPTSEGARLGQGTLRLAEGLATLQFDSGAVVILEAPATLTLMDSMNCKLTRGTAVSDIPDSALGFRIETPSANVVDYGTRFAVSVYEGTGETHTQVIEGRVQVEYARSNEVVELNTGQRNTVIGETLGAATDGAEHEHQTMPVKPINHGPTWTLLEPVKDAYTGWKWRRSVNNRNSDILLLVKKAIESGPANRNSYLGFDLSGINQKRIEEAELLLYFAPTGWGLASHVPDATFSVYGTVGEAPEWDESILNEHGFPGDPEVVRLGSFMIPQGVQKGRFGVHTDALSEFLREHSTSEITLQVVRDTRESNDGGLVHGFASRRHPVLPPPTLAIRQSSVD